VVADRRTDWIGSLDLKMETVNEVATRMTAKVIHEIGADIIGLVEAESRPALVRFHDDLLSLAHDTSYQHIMLIDGNDERGIDVAIMTRSGFDLEGIRSHVDDEENGKRIFSRDCAEYHIKTPTNDRLIVLVNHFKSKGFGSQATSDRKRETQAERVKAIYEDLRQGGASNVAVIGDFNDTPDSDPLASLIQSTDLKDITTHQNFNDGGRPGTFGNGTASNKIDYILLSPVRAIWGRETGALGMYGRGSRGPTRHVCSICSVVRTRDRVAGAGYACNARPDLHTVCRSFPKISSALSAKVCGGSRSAKILIRDGGRAAVWRASPPPAKLICLRPCRGRRAT
jgi:endonuclease/exonuclease/phosphatase family metal-dependent hydrolase